MIYWILLAVIVILVAIIYFLFVAIGKTLETFFNSF